MATDKKTKMQFDITKEMSKDDIHKIPLISIDAKYLKKFYDGLMKSIDKYNTDLNNQIEDGIVKSLSATIDTIGKNTKTINFKRFEVILTILLQSSQARLKASLDYLIYWRRERVALIKKVIAC